MKRNRRLCSAQRTRGRHGSILALLLLGGCLSACGDKQDWEVEIQLLLFKAAVEDVRAVEVTVSQQGGNTRQHRLSDVFTSCAANRLRIIPKKISGAYPQVTITARAAAPSSLVATTDVLLDPGQAIKEVSLLLGRDGPIEPSGECTTLAPAVPDAGPSPDTGAPQLKGTGEPCADQAECAGAICLIEVISSSSQYLFVDGYCSSSCDTSSCATGEGEYTVIKKDQNNPCYCLAPCGTGCRSGYTCNANQMCFPQQKD